jgi:hypothetical protein
MRFIDGKFELLKMGTNGFTCLVVREPLGRYKLTNFNQPAMKSILYTYQIHMKSLFIGYDYQQTYPILAQTFGHGILPLPKSASLVYIMSPNN